MHEGKGLGFHPGPVDERDFALAPRVGAISRPKTKGSTFYLNLCRLNQGAEGACVAFSWTQRVNAAPKTHRYDDPYAFNLYALAKTLDEWPGEDYDGTSVRAGAKASQQKKLINAYAFTYDVEEMAMWILNKAPVVIGVDWMENMDSPSKENDYYVKPTGRVRGGHAICVDGVRWNGDDRDYFRCLNSWSREWGMEGRCKVSVPDMDYLMKRDGAVCATAVES